MAYPLEADPDAAFWIVLDGHGKKGHTVSAEALYCLHCHLDNCAWGDSSKNEGQFIAAFEKVEERLWSFECDEDDKPAAMNSGAVAVVVLLRRGVLWVAHAGDSRAILGRDDENGELVAEQLTIDHVPDMPSEKLRIEGCGGWVRPEQPEPDFAPCRFYLSQAEPWRGPGLSMSRSLGDLDALPAGLSAEPT
eukprot:4912293-Prymnesium_polylepis.1